MARARRPSVADLVAEYEGCRSTYEDFGSECERLLNRLIDEADLRKLVQSVESRAKEVESLRDKLRSPDKQYAQLTDVTDLTGLRVITYFAEDVDKVAAIIDDDSKSTGAIRLTGGR